MWESAWANHLGWSFLLGGWRAKRKEHHLLSNWAEKMGPMRGWSLALCLACQKDFQKELGWDHDLEQRMSDDWGCQSLCWGPG